MADERPCLELGADGRVRVTGCWTIRALASDLAALRRVLARTPQDVAWQFDPAVRLDSFGAVLLWGHWQGRLPPDVDMSDEVRALFAPLAGVDRRLAERPPGRSLSARLVDPVAALGRPLLSLLAHGRDFVALIGQLALDLAFLAGRPWHGPWREFSANIHKVGVSALPVTALVGFLIGVVLSYLSALQLRAFGADLYIINILGLGIIRELGPVLVSVLVAGRSGSSMTAQIGVMRVTEEIDALRAFGISPTTRLVLPKVAALALVMPLLVLWTSAVALGGGMLSAWWQLGISPRFFLDTLPEVVPLANLFIALAKGLVFGTLIALVACHFGLRVRPNTESLSSNTTASVVTAITLVILVDAVFAMATRSIGVPG